MRCKHCGMSPKNSVHHNQRQFGCHEYTEYVEPEPVALSLEERIEQLERRINELVEDAQGRGVFIA